MNFVGLIPLIRALPTYSETLELLSDSGANAENITVLNIPRSAHPVVIAALGEDLECAQLTLTAQSERANILQQEILAWNPNHDVQLFTKPHTPHYQRASRGLSQIRQRLETLAMFSRHTNTANARAVTCARALMTPTLPPPKFHSHSQSLQQGKEIRLKQLLAEWVHTGYRHSAMVTRPGECSQRGGIIDVWPPTDTLPTRIELFGEQIESMRRFDPATQRSREAITVVHVHPAREALPGDGPEAARRLKEDWLAINQDEIPIEHHTDFENLANGADFPELEYYLPWLHPESGTLLDYLPEGCLIIVDNWQSFLNAVQEYEQQYLRWSTEQTEIIALPNERSNTLTSWSEIQDQISTHPILVLGGMDHEPQCKLGASFTPVPRHGGKIESLLEYLETKTRQKEITVVVTHQAGRISELWDDRSKSAPDVIPDTVTTTKNILDLPSGKSPVFVHGSIAAGFTLAQSSLNVLSDDEIFGWKGPKPRRPPAQQAVTTPEDSFTDFTSGQLVVHIEHGIGRFLRLVSRTINKLQDEYLQIEYGSGDSLYVPITQTDRLTQYVGPNSKTPKLSRLGSSEWMRVRQNTSGAVEEVARELLSLYAKREAASGHAFAADTAWQAELESSFPYDETEDQRKALADVKRDMMRAQPMDRLICGDVGYGKTEVALRAAFKAVLDGKQVAILVPTTVLAQQHFHTFRKRLASFPVHIEMLSRFRSRQQQKEIIIALAEGEIDIVIGTHRLVQSDISFNDLGLVIIDEEQRFGVTHKEHLKKLRASVDVLTLTATPIPRTLYMSLTGARDISTINTAPADRLPVETRVSTYSKQLLRQAIMRELNRCGQVYYVHNRVQTIGVAATKLAAEIPEARVVTAHGQMPEKKLGHTMNDFVQGKYDVLVCTSIIESGLDIPNANTLIVDNADMFGLAQLYQLRGRVGRGANQGYAYLLYRDSGIPNITLEAHNRLQTIAEQTGLGSGYDVAMHDLEMRGTGDIIGKRQHGHIAAVGFHLYARLLRKAVQRQKERSVGNNHTGQGLSLIHI